MDSSARRRRFAFILFLSLTLLWIAFIFGNSLSNGEDSSRQSGRVVQAIIKIADFFGIQIVNTQFLSHMVRKSAHFLEFALLGAFSYAALGSAGLCRAARIYFGASFCLLIAACDEYIQTFRIGRSGQASDVFLDLSGSAAAIALCFLFALPKTKRKRKQTDARPNEK